MRHNQVTRVAGSVPARTRPSSSGPAPLTAATTRKADSKKNDDRPDPVDDVAGHKATDDDSDDSGKVWIPPGDPVPEGMVPTTGPHGQPHDQKDPD